MKTPRQDTRNESEGAEFLVLGQLLIAGVPTFKSYRYTAGYDLIATNPEQNTSARISVKSRWATRAEGFIIKNFDCDFVVIAKLNRGSKDGRAQIRAPEFFVLPVDVAQGVPRTQQWGKVSFSKIRDLETFRDRWDLISAFLKATNPTNPAKSVSATAVRRGRIKEALSVGNRKYSKGLKKLSE